MEFTLLGAALIAVVAIYGTLWYEAGRTNAADCTRDVWDALITACVVGLIAGRLAAMVMAGSNPLLAPGDVLIVRGGVDTVGAVIAGVVTFGWMTRADVWHLVDAAAPAAVAGLAGWHGSCVLRGSCLGSASDLPWAMSQAGSAVTRHPVEIYAAFIAVVVAIGLILWKHRRPSPGVIAAVGLAGAAVARLVTEPLRPGLGEDLTFGYAAMAVVAGAVALVRSRAGTDGPLP